MSEHGQHHEPQDLSLDAIVTRPVSMVESTSAIYDTDSTTTQTTLDISDRESIQSASGIRTRMSFDSNSESPNMIASVRPDLPSRSSTTDSLSPDRDNGLRRIRSRKASAHSPTSIKLTSSAIYPSVSHQQTPQRRSSHPLSSDITGPPSPLMVLSDDLSRFPQESLHSFSFAHQSDESYQNRQNVLKRSIDFMKDKLNRTSPNATHSRASARLSGEDELQNVMDVLSRADLAGQLSPEVTPTAHTAQLSDPSALAQLEPINTRGLVVAIPAQECASPEELSPTTVRRTDELSFQNLDRIQSEDVSTAPAHTNRRSPLKRSLTDLDKYTLIDEPLRDVHTRSSQALDRAMQARANTTANLGSDESYKRHLNLSPNSSPHSHGTRQHAAAQAIFTTDTCSPWTITAANDLACLAFGVSMSEVRKMGIMEVICPDRRQWLESKLRRQDKVPRVDGPTDLASSPGQTRAPSPSLFAGSGVTAKLLSKPPSRETYQSRRSQTPQGRLDSATGRPAQSSLSRVNSMTRPSKGVLLCGDVVTIQKRNGHTGSASLWVKEKQGGFIWVLEEIAEDSARITLDEVGCIIRGSGSIEAIFGMERVRRGMDVKKLLPQLPKLLGTHTGALDYDRIMQVKRYTARTSNSINIPVTVDLMPTDELTMKVSSFPHIAGIMVVSAHTLRIISSNAVFSAALFGHESPDGLHINELIPHFDTLLGVISDEDSTDLVDGIVIPEQSFRRARSLLAIRQGRADAASIFLRPSGLPAKHRDGSEIMIDLQMRVLSNDLSAAEITAAETPIKVSYALWITYSRQLHAVNHGIGPVSPLAMSRPGTPPRQPAPLPLPSPLLDDMSADGSAHGSKAVSPILEEPEPISASSSPFIPRVDFELFENPTPAALAAGALLTSKKSIVDFAILEEMGKGAYGEVKLVRYKKTSAVKMVVKYVTKRRILVDTWTRDRRLGTVPLEIHVLDYLRRDGLQHRNIIEMADFFEDDVNYYIEMFPHGLPGVDLFDYIELRVNMGESECRQIFVQVASALHHLHNKARVVHRDIKDENVILDGQGAVKVVDFGSAAYIKSGPFDVFVGTIDYAAPEVLRGMPYRGKEQDVWALGILLYTIVYKENPFYSIDEIMDHDLRVPYVMSEECLDLIRRMLDRDVERRISIQDVLGHSWCKCAESATGLSSSA